MDDYEITEWNESNFDVQAHPFAKQSYETGRFAFVSDFARLKVLHEFGGIYLDTDVEVKKKFADAFLAYNLFLGFALSPNLSTAVIGAEKANGYIKRLLDKYDSLDALNVDEALNNHVFTWFFLNEFPEFRLNNRFQILSGNTAVFPNQYFETRTLRRRMGYSVHYSMGAWRGEPSRRALPRLVNRMIGDVLYSKMQRSRLLRKSPFYDTYRFHRSNRKWSPESGA